MIWRCVEDIALLVAKCATSNELLLRQQSKNQPTHQYCHSYPAKIYTTNRANSSTRANTKEPIYPALSLSSNLDKECEYPSMEHSTTSSRTNTGGSWFSSTASSNPNSGILPQFVNFAGGNQGGEPTGDETPNQQRMAAARRLLDMLRQNLLLYDQLLVLIRHLADLLHLDLFLMLLTLVVLCGLLYTVYTRTQKGPVIVSGYEIPPSLLYTLALMICFPMFALADVGEVMYWVIGSSFFLILAHSTFYCSEEVPGAEFEVVNVVQT
uniref:PRA1 family protein n=1 Tax=Ditylenchus dipsaci TaxID=166011 RepID=A0A915EM01_9BILA